MFGEAADGFSSAVCCSCHLNFSCCYCCHCCRFVQALLIEDALRVSQRQSRQQEKQREELQQQLFAALALRIRNQTAAGQQPLDVAEVRWPLAILYPLLSLFYHFTPFYSFAGFYLSRCPYISAASALQLLSADCPLPPRVSAALFSLLYRHSLPLLLHPQQQLLLLFSAFRAEQEQHWCGTAAQAGAALAGMAPGVLQGYLADIWKIRQKTAEAQDQWASFRLLACCL